MFGLTRKDISDSVVFYFLNIENYSKEFIQLMDSEICKIWNGDEEQESDITLVKLQIKNFIKNKSEKQKHGIVAEFICHLFLRSIDYKQHFLFQNLEEASLKKGFDGLYNVYIMDETHSIFACGASAVTKLREPGGNYIERIFNFKYPYEYIDRFEEILARKDGINEFYNKFTT